MVLFHAVTLYHVLFSVEYKLLHYEQDKAMLMVPHSLLESFPKISELKGIFNEVIVYHYYFPENTVSDVAKESKDYFDKELKSYGVGFDSFNEIYVCNSSEYIGVCLASNNIPFVFVEDGAGLLGKPDVLKLVHGKQQNQKLEYCTLFGLYDASAPCITRRIGNKLVKSNMDIEMEHFDVVKSLELIQNKYREKVKAVFNAPDYIEVDGNVLFLTEHLANQDLMSLDEQILIYQTTFDYFFENQKLVIKPHPRDLCFYEDLFPQYQVIREVFPSELIPSVLKKRLTTIATITSTGIDNIATSFDKAVSLGFRYREEYIFTDKYYIALKVAESLNAIHNIQQIGTDEKIVDLLIEYGGFKKSYEPTKNTVYLVDVAEFVDGTAKTIIDLLERINDDVVLFINTRKDYCFYDYYKKNIWNYIIPIPIIKTRIRSEDFYSDCSESVIYAYTKSEKNRTMIERFTMQRELSNMGIKLEVKSLSEYEQRIKVLEGMLEATEKRLLFYLDREKQRNNKTS